MELTEGPELYRIPYGRRETKVTTLICFLRREDMGIMQTMLLHGYNIIERQKSFENSIFESEVFRLHFGGRLLLHQGWRLFEISWILT